MKLDYTRMREVNNLLIEHYKQLSLSKITELNQFTSVPTTAYQIVKGDTIGYVAKRFKTTQATIIELNDIEYPYFSEIPLDGIKTAIYGKTILVPNPNQFTNNTMNKDALYGTSVKLSLDGDIELSEDSFTIISGEDNVVQRIDSLVKTYLGELLDEPGYGFPDFRGVKAGSEDYYMKIVEMKRQLLSEPAVESVEQLFVSYQSGTADVFYQVRLADRNEPFVGKVTVGL